MFSKPYSIRWETYSRAAMQLSLIPLAKVVLLYVWNSTWEPLFSDLSLAHICFIPNVLTGLRKDTRKLRISSPRVDFATINASTSKLLFNGLFVTSKWVSLASFISKFKWNFWRSYCFVRNDRKSLRNNDLQEVLFSGLSLAHKGVSPGPFII